MNKDTRRVFTFVCWGLLAVTLGALVVWQLGSPQPLIKRGTNQQAVDATDAVEKYAAEGATSSRYDAQGVSPHELGTTTTDRPRSFLSPREDDPLLPPDAVITVPSGEEEPTLMHQPRYIGEGPDTDSPAREPSPEEPTVLPVPSTTTPSSTQNTEEPSASAEYPDETVTPDESVTPSESAAEPMSDLKPASTPSAAESVAESFTEESSPAETPETETPETK